MIPDYYSILGVTPHSSAEQIKSAYRKLAQIHHPDKNNSPGAHNTFITIHEAYTILYNDALRKKYNEEYRHNQNYQNSTNYSKEQYNTERKNQSEKSYQDFTNFDLRNEANKARHNAEQFAKMAFADFYKILVGATKEVGFQISNVLLGIIGAFLLVGGINDSILFIASGFSNGNIIMVAVAAIGGYLVYIAQTRQKKRNESHS